MTLWQSHRDGSVAVAAYHNPPMNYLTGRGLDELRDLVAEWADPEVRTVVLTGTVPGRFITHFSVAEILAGQATLAEDGPTLNYRVHALFQSLNDLQKPVIAAMNGDTMGAGLELSLSADIRIAQAGDHRIGLPEVRLGLIPGGTGTQRLSRLVGRGRALDLILRGRILTPDEALALGLVTEVVDDAREWSVAMAHRLAALPPVALAMAKRVIHDASDLPLASALRLEADASFRTKLAPEASEAMQAYLALPEDARRDWLDAERAATS